MGMRPAPFCSDMDPARRQRTWKAAVVEGDRGSAEMSAEDMGDSSRAPSEEVTSSEGVGDLSIAAALVGLASSMASPIVTARVRLRICATGTQTFGHRQKHRCRCGHKVPTSCGIPVCDVPVTSPDRVLHTIGAGPLWYSRL